MKRGIFWIVTVGAVLAAPMSVNADDEVVTTTTSTTVEATTTTTTTTITTTTTTELTTTTVEQTTTTVVTTVAPSTTEAPATTTTVAAGTECPTEHCGYAVVDENNHVFGVIVCSNWCTGKTMTDSYMGCPAGCRLIVQTRQSPSGNVAGYAGSTYKPESNTFDVGGGYTLPAGNDVGDVIAPSTTTTIHHPEPESEPVATTVEETTTTTVALVASAVFGVERTIVRVSTKQITPKRKPVPKKPIRKKRSAR